MIHIFRIILVLSISWVSIFYVDAQAPKKYTSADLHDAIKRLNILGSALYVAAHPDDENTRLISWLSNHKRVNTAYLSLTRGDGGQNLIGTEIQELLGVIRTQELLMARKVDGGKQLFSRANDFGYSKNPEETLKTWNEEEVLSDVVWAIRKFQPDIIINRFPHDEERRTHGHHTSSAILSHRAFDLAADPKVYPEQLKYVDVWQPRRLFMNTSWWFYGSREKFAEADKSKMVSVDVGTYYPLKGKSNNEIAAESRSKHACQGMGSTPSRGSQQEYLQILKGDMPGNKEALFDGINTNWSRLKGGKAIGLILSVVEKTFNYDNPAASLPQLMEAYELIKKLPEGNWRKVKLEEIKSVIQGCAGLYLEASTSDPSVTPGEEFELTVEAISRMGNNIKLNAVSILPMEKDTAMQLDMETNQVYKWTHKVRVPNDFPYSNPYWLNEPSELGMYTVEDQLMRGLPETPRLLKVKFNLTIHNSPIDFEMDMVYKKTYPDKGEIYQPFEVIPPVFANITEKVYVFANKEAKKIQVLIKAGKDNVKGKIMLEHPENWRVEPASVDIAVSQKGEEQRINFKVFPPDQQHVGEIKAVVEIDHKKYDKEMIVIAYDHIPTQSVFRDAKARIVKVNLKKEGEKVGYIMGAGDEVPSSLEQVGYQVDYLNDNDIREEVLEKYDAIIVGIRAYNTNERIKFHQPKLMEYVENGGTMIVQYNTAHRLKTKDIAPYPLKLSRQRVAVEDAEVRIIDPEHHVLNYPNKITSADFDGWIQERGLYFPDEWDEAFETILSCNDPNESPLDGGLLVAKFGKGYYIYSGYSWFRELPAGVPGAYRLFTNMISIGKRP